jgi:PAS domain S-box-containing protein
MTTSTSTLLIIEDFSADRELYRRALLADPNITYHLLEVESVAEGLELCQTKKIDAVLLDYLLPDADGLEFLGQLADRNDPDAPAVVMLTGQGNESIAVRAIKLGAQDYLVKRDLTPELLQLTVRKAIHNSRLKRQLQQCQERSDSQLQAANQRTIEIWESMTDAYVTVDGDWRLIYANQAATQVICQLTNLAPIEFLGRSHWDLFPSLVGTDAEREFRRALTDLVTVHVEVWFEPTGSWFETHLYPAAEGLGIYFRDISRRKRMEAERLAAEQERDRFFNLSIDLLGVANFDGYFTRLNPAFERVLGFTPAELTAQPFLDFVHPDDRATTVAAERQLIAGGALVSFENRYRCRDGSYRWLLWSAMPDLEQKVTYASGHDITDRKQAEAALQASERKFSAIFDQSFELMGIVSLDGRLLEVNQTALDSIEAQRADVCGQYFWDTPWWQTEQLKQQLQTAIERAGKGELIRYEAQFPDSSGVMITTDFSLKPVFDAAGKVWTIVAEAHDITERNQIQSDLQARNQELDSFVYIVSHDLKAPLRAVSNLSQWIEEDLAGSLTAANQRQMDLLRDRLDRMSATIDGLLNYARIGRTEESIEPVAVAELVAQTLETLALPPTFQIAIAKNLPTLNTKRLLLTQVFANLVGNAIKHHDRLDGALHIGIAERSDVYEFAIADDGPGIAPEQHDRVFEIFQAVNPQQRSDSTGIGLAIVKKIIEAEGGTIRLESQLGKGTTFYFTWPKRLAIEERVGGRQGGLVVSGDLSTLVENKG